MSEASSKRKLLQDRKVAAKKLRGTGYGVFSFDDGPFSIIAVRLMEARFVRIVLGKIGPEDVSVCSGVSVPTNCAREVWRRIGNSQEFDIKQVP